MCGSDGEERIKQKEKKRRKPPCFCDYILLRRSRLSDMQQKQSKVSAKHENQAVKSRGGGSLAFLCFVYQGACWAVAVTATQIHIPSPVLLLLFVGSWERGETDQRPKKNGRPRPYVLRVTWGVVSHGGGVCVDVDR